MASWGNFFAEMRLEGPSWASYFAEMRLEGPCWASYFAEMRLEGLCWASFVALQQRWDPAGRVCCAVCLAPGPFCWQR